MDQAPPGFSTHAGLVSGGALARARVPEPLHVNRAPLTLRVGEGGKVEDLAVGPIDPIRTGELFAAPR